jgi:predicted Zn-dependent peptidase
MAAAVVSLVLALLGARSEQSAPVARRQTLPNGLEIIVVESRLTPLVSLAVAMRRGSMMEGPKESGLQHLLEHMLYRPNQALPTPALLTARRRELGITFPGATYEEVMSVAITNPAPNLAGALTFLHDMVVSPRFDEATLAIEEKLMALEEGHRSGDDRGQRAGRLDKLLWWKHLSRKTHQLESESLPALTVADLQRSKDQYLVPNNAALVVVGDVDAARVLERATTAFGDWKRGPTTTPAQTHLPRHPPLRRTQVVVEPVESPVVAGALTWQGPSTLGPESTLSHAAGLLGAAVTVKSAALEKIGQSCMALDLFYTPSPNVGTFMASWMSAPERADACILAIVAQLPGFLRGLTNDDLEAAREVVEGQLLRGREDPELLMRDLAKAWASGDLSESLDIVPKLAAVDRDDVGRVVNRFIDGHPFVLSVHLSPAQIARGSDLRHFEELMRTQPPRKVSR